MTGADTALSIILVVGGTVYLAICLVALRGLFRSPLPSRRTDGRTPRVSVIVAARNEQANIGNLLDDLLAQDYPAERMEVIAVDDCSEDNTQGIIASRVCRDRRVRYSDTRNSHSPYSHKKRAVHEGILSSEGDIILTIDADCRVSSSWIRGITSHFTDTVDLVAGRVVVEGQTLIGKFEALEFTGIQSMAAGLMNAGFPITCNGANLAYRRSAFQRVDGFGESGRMVSGDDDLLMQRIAGGNPQRVVFATGSETAVYVPDSGSVREFLSKRTRWASKIGAYPSKSALFLLGSIFFFFIAAPSALVALCAGRPLGIPLLIGYGMKMTGDLSLTAAALRSEGRLALLALFLPAEIVHVPYIIAVTLRGFFGTFEWHGRRTGACSPNGTGG